MNYLQELNVLIAVVEKGNFSAAANSLRMSPSAVSKLISRIENRIGVRLFDRTQRTVHLTYEGELYLQSVQRAADALSDLETLGESLGKIPRGIIRVHSTPVFARQELAPIMPEFRKIFPDLCVDFRLGPRFTKLEDDIDFGIFFGSLQDSSMVLHRVAASRRILCASKSYLEKHGKPKAITDLPNHKLLNFTLKGRESWPFYTSKGVKTIPIVSQFRSDDADFLRHLAHHGMGIARLAEFHILEDIKIGKLVPIFPEYSAKEGIFVVTRIRRNLSPRFKVFIKFLEQHLKDRPWNLDT